MKGIKAKIKRYSKMSLTAVVAGFFGAILITVLALFVRRRKKKK
ncbi:LPXTG cell wall anchor domain-containing protein [Patescibacteria group bacterium]|nr:LPXTG cell wall anchor domain-containing protein [Patescibacteria group bacterium]